MAAQEYWKQLDREMLALVPDWNRKLVFSAKRLRGSIRAKPHNVDTYYRDASSELLLAAVEWRSRAIERKRALGRRLNRRPLFSDPPSAFPNRPGWGAYYDGVLWWASRYAWDSAQGKDADHAANGLIAHALRGWDNGEPVAREDEARLT